MAINFCGEHSDPIRGFYVFDRSLLDQGISPRWVAVGATQLPQVNYDDPVVRDTFEKCKLRFSELEDHCELLAFHKHLIKLKKTEDAFSRQDWNFDGAVLDRLLLINLGKKLNFNPVGGELPRSGGNGRLT